MLRKYQVKRYRFPGFYSEVDITFLYLMSTKGKQIEAPQIPIETLPQQSIQNNKSQYGQEFASKMSEFQSFARTNMEKLSTKNSENLVIQEEFNRKFQMKIKEESINKEVIVITAEWGYYSIDIKILNIQGENTKHNREMDCGMFGSIYKGKFNKEEFIIKCLPLQYKDSRFRAIKEWFIMKIASIAGVGPKLEPYFGFDILMFSECIQFAMEQCKQISVHNSKTHQFYQNLSVLHKLHIVHQDIKPENIMYSPGYDRPVFIDFGLSRLVQENIGFKTMSNYVGTIDYWSPEMGKCFIEKKQMPIDLYYNDLYGLEKTIEVYKSQLIYDTEDDIYKMCEIGKIDYFSYLSLILVKFYLYEKQFSHFLKQYHLQIKNQNQNSNFSKNEIFYFFEELPPTEQVRNFFKSFISTQYSETGLYSKLNVLYQVSRKNVCSLDMFINKEKYNYFTNMCAQMMVQGNQEPNKQLQKQNIDKLMTNDSIIKNIPFHKYLSVYLGYISYIWNKYDVSQQQRKKAAQIYYKIFINIQIESLKQKEVLNKTIIHALQWCLTQQKQRLFDKVATLLFKLYDFLLILDFATAKQFLQWLNKIYEHRSLCTLRKNIFFQRVQHSNHLNIIRCNSNKHKSWRDFSYKIRQWIAIKKKQNKIRQNLCLQQIQSLPYQFQVQFGIETIEVLNIKSKLRNQVDRDILMIDLFYKLLGMNKNHHRICYYFVDIYYEISAQRQNINVCKQIQNIFRQCLRDQQIMNQYNFKLSSILYDKFIFNPRILSFDDLNYINQEIAKVQATDLYFLSFSLLSHISFEMFHLPKQIKKQKLNIFYHGSGFMSRIYQCFKQTYSYIFQNSQIDHRCDEIVFYQLLLTMSHILQPETHQRIKSQLKDEIFWKNKGCQLCNNIVKLILKVYQLNEIISQRSNQLNGINNFAFKSNEEFLDCFFQYYCSFWNQVKDRNNIDFRQLSIIMNGLVSAERLCFFNPNYQQKYSGIMNFYVFLKKWNNLQNYLASMEKSGSIDSLLQLMKSKSLEHFAQCLHQFAFLIGKNLIVKWYIIFGVKLQTILFKFSNEELKQLFLILQKRQLADSQHPERHYIVVLYSSIACATKDPKLFKKIHCAILKNIDDLSFGFKRYTSIKICQRLISSNIINIQKIKKRECLYYNNIFIKLLMNFNETVPRKKRQKMKDNIFQRFLIMKMDKIQIWNKNRSIPAYRYRKK